MQRDTPSGPTRRQQCRLPPLLLILLALVLCATDAQAQDNLHAQANDAIFREFYEPGVIHIKFADAMPWAASASRYRPGSFRLRERSNRGSFYP